MTENEARRPATAATAIGINSLKPIVHFQISMLRMWAVSIERLARDYDKGLKETAEEQSDKERAASGEKTSTRPVGQRQTKCQLSLPHGITKAHLRTAAQFARSR